MTPFGQFLARPSTTILLNQMLADNARVDASIGERWKRDHDEATKGPRQCCSEFASIVDTDGKLEWWSCGACGYQWFVPCAKDDAAL